MNIKYRNITKSDYPFLREMLYEAIFVEVRVKQLLDEIIELPEILKYIDNWVDSEDFGLIILADDEEIGAIWGRLFLEKNKGYGYVDDETPELSMAIKSNYRNKGLGTKLMNEFLVLAKNICYKALSLSVDKRSKAAGFYKRIGFTIFDELETANTMIIKL